MGLNYPEHSFLVHWDLFFKKVVPRSCDATEEEDEQRHKDEVLPRIRAFFEASEERRAFLERKIREQLAFFEVEKKHNGFKRPREIIESSVEQGPKEESGDDG